MMNQGCIPVGHLLCFQISPCNLIIYGSVQAMNLDLPWDFQVLKVQLGCQQTYTLQMYKYTMHMSTRWGLQQLMFYYP